MPSDFLWMNHADLDPTNSVRVPQETFPYWESRGWFLTDPPLGGGPPRDEYVNRSDLERLLVAGIADLDLTGVVTPAAVAATFSDPAVSGPLSASYAQKWQPVTSVAANDIRLAPTGQVIKRTASGTTRSTYDATEAALWSVVAGGSDLTGAIPVNGRIEINTAGNADIVSRDTYVTCVVSVTGVPGVADVAMTGKIKGRGNSTWGLPKKPYRLKLDTSAPLLGLPTSKDWALLANYLDKGGINYALALTVGKAAEGLDWTPRFGFCEVYLNGAYNGRYQLIETIDFGGQRITGSKAGTSGAPLTGGYIMEAEGQALEVGDFAVESTHLTNPQRRFLFKSPDDGLTANVSYMTTYLHNFEDVLFGDGWLDPTTGYKTWIDLDSFVDWYLIEELAANQESTFASSCYMVKPRDVNGVVSKLFMGPLWDFDCSFGQKTDGTNSRNPRLALASGSGSWAGRMMQDPAFVAACATRWTALKASVTAAGGFAAMVDALIARVAAMGVRDAAKWSYANNWAANQAFTKAWVSARVAWMNQYLGTDTSIYPATYAATY